MLLDSNILALKVAVFHYRDETCMNFKLADDETTAKSTNLKNLFSKSLFKNGLHLI